MWSMLTVSRKPGTSSTRFSQPLNPGIIGEPAPVALEQAMIGRIEADQGDEQADVDFHQFRAEQEGAAAFKAPLQRIQHGKNLFKGLS